MSRSRFRFPAARRWPRRRGTRGSASSAGCPFWARRASCIRFPARPGSPRSTAASTWRAPWGFRHVAGCTGSTSEDAVRAHYGLPLEAMLDMGDFAGGLAQVSPRPSGGARHHRRRFRQDHQAGAGCAGPAFGPLPGRSRLAGGPCARTAARARARRQHGAAGAGHGRGARSSPAAWPRRPLRPSRRAARCAGRGAMSSSCRARARSSAMPRERILILGGTRDARELAAGLLAEGYDVITSLAGVTENPVLPAGEVRRRRIRRRSTGCARYPARRRPSRRVVDATHPFRGADVASTPMRPAATASVRLLRLERPAGPPVPGDHWITVRLRAGGCGGAAAEARRSSLTIGRKEIGLVPGAARCRRALPA